MIDLQKDMPAWVQFETRAIEDRAATIANGYFTTKDEEYALITPPYSKDQVCKKVKDWLVDLDDHVRNNRMPEKWAEGYKAKYKAWKNGQEIPEDGIPIKGWSMLSPAVQANLLQIGVRTVESLAKINDEGMKRYGMGALDLKNQAIAYLRVAKDVGPVAKENAAMKLKVESLETQLKQLLESNKELTRRLDAQKVAA